MKPKKIPYKKQTEVYKEFIEFIKPFFKKFKEIKKAYIWGSLAEGTFGLYEKPYRNQVGSDVDLGIFIDKNYNLPKNWKDLEANEEWFDLYKDNDYRKFQYRKTIHKVDLLVAHKNKTLKNINENIIKFKLIYEK